MHKIPSKVYLKMYNHNSFSTTYSISVAKNNKVPANCQILYTATNAVMIFAYLGVWDWNAYYIVFSCV